MARITYQDNSITEYDDGTVDVTFTDAEWEVMLADPAFGYVCSNGHRLSDSDRQFIAVEGICPTCFAAAEDAYYDYLDAEAEATPEPVASAPTEEEPF